MLIIKRFIRSTVLIACCTIFFMNIVATFAAESSLDKPLIYGYNKRIYDKKYKIDVFMTKPSTQSIEPLVYTNGNKQKLSDMTPEINKNIIAKTNANAMSLYSKNGDAFYGLYYVNGKLYADGVQLKNNKPENFNVNDKEAIKYYPSFCIYKNGTASIRWFSSSSLASSLKNFASIIGITHALVYQSKSVFENIVKDRYDGGYVIYDLKNVNNPLSHYYPYCKGNHSYIRTLVGHTLNGSFLMVTTETEMDLTTAARMMAALGCDYAGNLDGSNAVQMRVTAGYTNGANPGRVTPPHGHSDDYYYGTGISAFVK